MTDWIDTHESIPEGIRREMCFTLDYSLARIAHCVEQLSDEDLWWRPHPKMNAVGNILLHVAGNLRQWIVSGVGGEEDTRERDAEFAQRETIPKAVLMGRLTSTVDEARAAIRNASDAELLRTRYVQVADVTGLGAIVHSVAHLEGHAQEIIYATRLRLGDRYRFKDLY